jgi:hypothetical protein
MKEDTIVDINTKLLELERAGQLLLNKIQRRRML